MKKYLSSGLIPLIFLLLAFTIPDTHYRAQKIKMNVCTSWVSGTYECFCNSCQCYEISYTTNSAGIITGITGYTAATNCINSCNIGTPPYCFGTLKIEDVQDYVNKHRAISVFNKRYKKDGGSGSIPKGGYGISEVTRSSFLH